MKDECVRNIGVWGKRHYDYLKKYSPTVINVMRMNGTLEQYLRDLDRDAQDMFDLLVRQYAEIEGITEQQKAENQMDWVCRMNSIKSTFFDFNLVLYIEGKNELLLSEIFFPFNVISMKQIYYRYNCYIGIMMTG